MINPMFTRLELMKYSKKNKSIDLIIKKKILKKIFLPNSNKKQTNKKNINNIHAHLNCLQFCTTSLADLRGREGRIPPIPPSPDVQILSISCSFREHLAKSCVHAPLESSRSRLGEILYPPLHIDLDLFLDKLLLIWVFTQFFHFHDIFSEKLAKFIVHAAFLNVDKYPYGISWIRY